MNALRIQDVLLVTILLAPLCTSVSSAEPEKVSPVYLDSAHAILIDKGQMSGIRAQESLLAMKTRLAILRYPLNEDAALVEARALPAFHASLALGGMAAVSIHTAPKKADALFQEALSIANGIPYRRDRQYTSLGFLFQLIPLFPKEQSRKLLAQGSKTLSLIQVPAFSKSHAMRMLAEATIAVNPAGARELLVSQALSDYAYEEALQLLATFLFKHSPTSTLRLARKLYAPNKLSTTHGDFMKVVLVEYAKHDFEAAFAEVQRMADPGRVITCFTLGKSLLERGHKDYAARVLDYMATLNSPMEVGKFTLPKMEDHLKELKRVNDRSRDGFFPQSVTPQIIDTFLSDKRGYGLGRLLRAQRIVFRSKLQAAQVAELATKASGQLRESHRHGREKSAALGLAACAAALGGKPERALHIAQAIRSPEMKAIYFMNMHELQHPLPSVLRGWPIAASQMSYSIEAKAK